MTGGEPPQHLAKYLGKEKLPIDPILLGRSSTFQTVTILANLVISDEGKFDAVSIMEITPSSLQGQEELYRQIVKTIYQNERFEPGYDKDPKVRIFSNLVVRVTIK